MHAIWSGSISFGLINIPIHLYSGTKEHAVEFDLLHKTDLSPIRYARICKLEEKEVPYKDIVKGYEYEKGEYVVLDEDDFNRVNSQKSATIEIIHFTDKKEIDSIYFDKPYFVEPGKGAGKSYVLLCEALAKTGKVAVVTYIIKNKEHVGILKPYRKLIILNQMRFAAEIRDTKDLKVPKEEKINKKELDMAVKLVDQLTEKFKAEEHKDEHTKVLQQIIAAKVKGEVSGKKRKGAPKPSKVHDIMALLKASLEEDKAKAKIRKRA